MGAIGNRGSISAHVSAAGSASGDIRETLLKGNKGDKGDPGRDGKEPISIFVDDGSCLNIVFNDGTSFKSPSILGPQGVGIQSIELNADHGLAITLTDGTVINTGSVQGEKGDKGDTGNGIAGAVLNPDYTLTLTWTDGNTFTTPIPIRGEKGDAYILTAEDKAEIYDLVLSDYPAVEEVGF